MKKLQCTVLMMGVCLAGGVFGNSYYASGTTGLWTDTWVWGNATNYPAAGDIAYLNLASTVSINGTAESAQELHLASWSGNSNLVTLNIVNGGSLSVTGWTYIGVANGDYGLLRVNAASALNANSALNVGYNGNGTLEVNGGTVNANGGLFVSNPWASGTGAGTVSLLGGIINVSTDFAMSSSGLIDIHAGTLSIYGLWWDSMLNGLINANRIIGYGGTQSVNIDHIGDYTVLTSIPEPMTLSLLGLGLLGVLRRKS